MAAASGQPGPDLSELVCTEPEGFEVFAAARIFEEAAVRTARAEGRELPPEIGGQGRGAGRADPVRFYAATTLGFPGAAVVSAGVESPGPAAEPDPGDARPAAMKLEIASFGLVGPSGVLPRHYTVLLLERMRRFRDRTLRNFLDIFTHRAMSLLVRGWGKYRVALQRSRLAGRGEGVSWDDAEVPRDGTAAILACLVGLGNRAAAGRMRAADEMVFHYAGHLSRQPAAALPLEQVVSDAWGVPAAVEQFVGRWLQVEPGDQTCLAAGRLGNTALGVDTLAGQRVWSVEAAYRIRLGPLALAEFERWLPGRGQLEALADLVTYHVGPTLEASIRLVLHAGDVPGTQLGDATQLGWTSWLLSEQPDLDADDAEFIVRVTAAGVTV